MDCGALDPVIGLEEFLELSRKETTVILDCRGSQTDSAAGELLYTQGHIPGAQRIDMARDVTGVRTGKNGRTPLADPETFASLLRRFGLTEGGTLLLYDREFLPHAPRVWFTVRTIGFANVFVLDGGFTSWVKAGLPLETEAVTKPEGNVTAKESLERVFTVKEIEENLISKKYLLVDARVESAYLGKNGGADPRAGHIPGSLSYPARLNIAPSGLFYGKDRLRENFLKLSDGAPERILHTCGSGVAACLNLLATRHAGLATAGVYIGSFSEWISDPDHQVSTEDES